MKSIKEKLSYSLKIALLSALMTSSNMVHAEDTNNSTFQLDSEKREEIKQKWQNAPQEKKMPSKQKCGNIGIILAQNKKPQERQKSNKG